MKHKVLYSTCFPSQGEYYTTRVKEKTSAQHQQPHKNQEYPHKRKLPFLPSSAAAATINTADLLGEDNSDATKWQWLQNMQRKRCLSWKILKEGFPKPWTPFSKAVLASLDTTRRTQSSDLSDLTGNSQGVMQSQASEWPVSSGFYVSQETDQVCRVSEEEGQSLTNALLLRLSFQNIFSSWVLPNHGAQVCLGGHKQLHINELRGQMWYWAGWARSVAVVQWRSTSPRLNRISQLKLG